MQVHNAVFVDKETTKRRREQRAVEARNNKE